MMEWLLIASAVFVFVLLLVGIYQFLWRNIRDYFRDAHSGIETNGVNFLPRSMMRMGRALNSGCPLA